MRSRAVASRQEEQRTLAASRPLLPGESGGAFVGTAYRCGRRRSSWGTSGSAHAGV
jgi:hypothetical protein